MNLAGGLAVGLMIASLIPFGLSLPAQNLNTPSTFWADFASG
jgi:hypothetical protein